MKGRKPFRIVVAEPYAPQALARLEKVGEVTVLDNPKPDTLIASLHDADALLIRAKAHVTARIIDAAPRLKVIGRASPTMDHIDLRAASQRDIRVVYSPDSAVKSAAEFTLGLILALHRRLPFFDRQLREGKFETIRRPTGHEMGNQTLGLLGADRIAEELARIVSVAFGPRIITHDPFGRRLEGVQAEALDLDGLLAEVDVLSIHLRATSQTRRIMDAKRLAMMKTTAILVNTSRGPVVDTVALADALKEGRIAAAGLDVFESEPLPPQHPLRRAPNCLLTPHVAGATLDASFGRFQVAEDVVRVLNDQPPRYPFSLPPA